ncbi:hypothetical protein BC941DRAFT_86835 [Chlamydoabsidia padenii]|nr:hypothetical protein BC941DRAFT_86835 [Chlamydoabsidia padenii]
MLASAWRLWCCMVKWAEKGDYCFMLICIALIAGVKRLGRRMNWYVQSLFMLFIDPSTSTSKGPPLYLSLSLSHSLIQITFYSFPILLYRLVSTG